MKRTTLISIGVVAATLGGCSESSSYEYVAPATVEEVSDGLWQISLTPIAAERTGIETTAVSAAGTDGQLTIPYSAVMYHYDGTTWAYSGDALTFVRKPIDIDRIVDGVAYLNSGPEVGVPVVTVGAAELYGVEFGIGK